MDKKLILELNNHNVYYIKTDTINFYITIPKTVQSTSICIELKNKMSNYNMELNDEIWVMENIKNTYSYIDNYNITLVLPILNEEQISILEKIDSSRYGEIDKSIAKVINTSYTFLKENNKQIGNQIILVNNERYKTFINWFLTRYQERVICKNLLELIQLFNANATAYKKIETPVMNFVVGSYNNEVTAPKITIKEEETTPKEIKEKNKKMQVSYGYASYWILAIVTIIVSTIVAIAAFTMK